MSPLFSEPSSGSLLHSQERNKVKVLTLTCSAPHGLFLASLLELSSHHPPLLLWLHSLLPLCDFLNVPDLASALEATVAFSFPWNVHSPYMFMTLTLFTLLTNDLQINVFKIVPPPGHKKIIPPPFTSPYPSYSVLLFLLALFILCIVYCTL